MNAIKIANYRPIVLSAVCLALGIFVGALTSNIAIAFFTLLGFFIVLTIVSFFLKFTTLKIATIFVLIGFVAISITCFTTQTDEVKYENVYFEGRVKEISKSNGMINRYVVEDVEFLGDKVNGKVLLDAVENYEIGDVVAVFGSLESIPFDPFDSYSVSKYRKKIIYSSISDTTLKIGETPKTIVEKIRYRVNNLYQTTMGRSEGAIALALVLGDRSQIDYDTSQDMQASGLSHLFSVSGLHVGFMSTIIFYLFRLLKVEKKKSVILVVLILFLYGLLTGFPVGVVRASIMSLLVLFAEIRTKRYDQLNGLALAVIILLLINPLDLFSVSFLLSVGAMFGIACFYHRITSIYRGDSILIKRLLGAVAVSVSANVFVIPISAYYFGTVSLYFILANLVVVPLASLVYFLLVPLTLFALIIPYLGILITPIGFPIVVISAISTGIANIPSATVGLNMPSLAGLLYSFGFIIISRYYMGSKYSKIVISLLSFIACALIIFLI